MATVSSMYRNVRGLRSAISDVGRVRQIATVLAGHGFGAFLDRLQLAETFGLGKILSTKEDHLPFERRLRLVCEELGPTFIKLGQVLSTRGDILSPEIIKELQHLQDDVPPMPWADVQTQVRTAMGQSLDEVFDSFDEEPLASASVAQVHRARLPGGEDVVVKVQRMRIAKAVRSDLNILHFIASRAEALVPELEVLDPVGIIREFDRALTSELDFSNEKRHLERFGQNFKDFEGIDIPQVYGDYCTKTLLTMAYVDGLKVTEAVPRFGLDAYAMATTMLRALFKMMFEDGIFHGDLHPGNVLVREDGTIVLIDFGLVGRLLPKHRDALVDLLMAMAQEDYESVARVFFELGVKMPGVHYDYGAFEQDIVELADRHINLETIHEIDVQAFFQDLVSGAMRHRIKMPPTYTMVFKALMTVEGIGKTLTPELKFIDEVKPFATQIIAERYKPERLFKNGMETLALGSRFARQVAMAAPRLLQEVELGHLQVQVESERFSDIRLEIQRIGTRLIRAIVFGSSFLAATMTLDAPGKLVFGINVFSFGAFVIAAIAGVPLIFSLLSRD